MNCAGFIYDDSPHYLDHLAPLCSLLNFPLIICEPHIAALARTYYPGLSVIEQDLWSLSLPKNVISCYSQALLDASFPNFPLQNIWLPHGNSDKGWKTRCFEALKQDKIAFVYGQQMIDAMREQKVFPEMICLGNFRWAYYVKNRAFYRKLLSLPNRGKNILYAPTWDDFENSCSFWTAFPHLIHKIPREYNLLIRLHPNTIRKFEPELEKYKALSINRENTLFLSEFPPVYPVLETCDAYIGDMSSIGYDFLKFDKPLFFFDSSRFPLQQCGESLLPENFTITEQAHLSSKRQQLYRYTFSKQPNWDFVRERLNLLIDSL